MSAVVKAAEGELRLIDTNVASYLLDELPPVQQYERLLKGFDAAICFMTVGELYQGAYLAHWGPKRFRKLIRFLERYPILESSWDAAQRWAEIRALRRRQPISVEDAWIAATALAYRCPLETHNPKDFQGIPGLRVVTAVV